jgi:hypothetical protein
MGGFSFPANADKTVPNRSGKLRLFRPFGSRRHPAIKPGRSCHRHGCPGQVIRNGRSRHRAEGVVALMQKGVDDQERPEGQGHQSQESPGDGVTAFALPLAGSGQPFAGEKYRAWSDHERRPGEIDRVGGHGDQARSDCLDMTLDAWTCLTNSRSATAYGSPRPNPSLDGCSTLSDWRSATTESRVGPAARDDQRNRHRAAPCEFVPLGGGEIAGQRWRSS